MNVPGFLTRNLRLKAFATGLSVATWVAVVYSGNPPETRTVAVHIPQEPTAIPAAFVLVQPIPDIALHIHGTREHLANFDPTTISVSVLYAAIKKPGVNAVPVMITNHDADVEVDPPPTTIAVDVDSLTAAPRTVQLFFNPPPPRGYVVSAGMATPAQVVVTGPSREVGEIVATATLDLSQQKTNLNEQVAVILKVKGHRISDVGLDRPTVQVTATMTQSATSRASAVVPRTTGAVAGGHQLGGISVDPATVTLAGPQDLLNALDSVPTAVIDLGGLAADHTVIVTIITPAGVRATPDTATVHIAVKTLPTLSSTFPPPPSPTPTP